MPLPVPFFASTIIRRFEPLVMLLLLKTLLRMLSILSMLSIFSMLRMLMCAPYLHLSRHAQSDRKEHSLNWLQLIVTDRLFGIGTQLCARRHQQTFKLITIGQWIRISNLKSIRQIQLERRQTNDWNTTLLANRDYRLALHELPDGRAPYLTILTVGRDLPTVTRLTICVRLVVVIVAWRRMQTSPVRITWLYHHNYLCHLLLFAMVCNWRFTRVSLRTFHRSHDGRPINRCLSILILKDGSR